MNYQDVKLRGQLYFLPPQQSFVVIEWHQTDTTTTAEFQKTGEILVHKMDKIFVATLQEIVEILVRNLELEHHQRCKRCDFTGGMCTIGKDY